jgi:hypothetical protein
MMEITHVVTRHFSSNTHTASLMTTLAKGEGVRQGGGGLRSQVYQLLSGSTVCLAVRGDIYTCGGGGGRGGGRNRKTEYVCDQSKTERTVFKARH